MSGHPGGALAWTLVAVALAGGGCGGGGDPLERARKASEEGDAARAIASYREYLEETPDDYAVLKEYALTLGEQWATHGGDREPVVDALEDLYERRPGDSEVQGLLAVMLVRDGQAAAEAGRREEAEAAYRRAIAVNPESGAAQFHLGKLYAEWDRPDEAFAQFRAAAAKRPPIPELYLALGREYLERGEPERAVTTLGLVLELSGMSTYLIPEAHCVLAEAHAELGNTSEALESLDRAPEDCPARSVLQD